MTSWMWTALTGVFAVASFVNVGRTLRASRATARMTARVWARNRVVVERSVAKMADVQARLTGIPSCPACGLPYAMVRELPDTAWEHPYCPAVFITA